MIAIKPEQAEAGARIEMLKSVCAKAGNLYESYVGFWGLRIANAWRVERDE
jgi:hypothetical protein